MLRRESLESSIKDFAEKSIFLSYTFFITANVSYEFKYSDKELYIHHNFIKLFNVHSYSDFFKVSISISENRNNQVEENHGNYNSYEYYENVINQVRSILSILEIIPRPKVSKYKFVLIQERDDMSRSTNMVRRVYFLGFNVQTGSKANIKH